jgi:transposase
MPALEKRWARPVMPRQQTVLSMSLDDLVPQDHVIRMVDAVLDGVDWTAWEAHYADERRGQPPIHPRLIAGCILYGLSRKIRSSRELEEATRERLDFRWFLDGRDIDHSTFAAFRTVFTEGLKELHRQVARLLLGAHDQALEMLVTDGTRLRANSDRHGARTAQTLERLVGRYAQMLDERLEQMAAADTQDAAPDEEIAVLRAEIQQLTEQLDKYKAAAAAAAARDGERRKKEGSKAAPVSVPVTDPDASIVPNKEGGHAPNYTPTVTVDAQSGAIVSGFVPEGAQESAAIMPAVEEAHALGKAPQRVMADTGFSSGENLEHLHGQAIEACMPTGTDFRPSNPANRPDPAAPVPEAQWDRLPMAGKKLRPSAFLYDAEQDHYRCPMGKALTPNGTGRRRNGVPYTTYTCGACQGCPLAARCLSNGAVARSITRDQYQHLRDEAGRRMATEEGQSLYKKRAPLVETAFARIKTHMGIRGFSLRGLDKVRTEWDWICCAYNLKLLLRQLQAGCITLAQSTTGLGAPAAQRLHAGCTNPLQSMKSALHRALDSFTRVITAIICPRPPQSQRKSGHSLLFHILRQTLKGGLRGVPLGGG